jgi:hypothetical protein
MSAAVVYLNMPPRHSLNLRQLLTPLFFPWGGVRHPDMKRQDARKQKARNLRAARALKAKPVPLCRVDPTVYLRDYAWDGTPRWHVVVLQKSYGSAYRAKVRRSCEEVEND